MYYSIVAFNTFQISYVIMYYHRIRLAVLGREKYETRAAQRMPRKLPGRPAEVVSETPSFMRQLCLFHLQIVNVTIVGSNLVVARHMRSDRAL
jgi:magnesium-transporting ATPase (P-type)